MGTVALSFGDKLRSALNSRNMGVRTLAGKLANGDKSRREVIRRRLNKYIHEGVTPTEPARREIESALDMSEDELKGDLDEEGDPAMREAFAVFVDLMALINAANSEKQAVSS